MNTQAVQTDRRQYDKCRHEIIMMQQALGQRMCEFDRNRKLKELAEFIVSVRRG